MIEIYPLGDSAFQVKFGNDISPHTLQKITGFIRLINEADIKGITELVPSYTDLLIHYHPLIVDYKTLVKQLKQLAIELKPEQATKPKTVHIPVLYGEPFGKDLPHVAQHTKLNRQQIIELHTKPDYLVYMLGFTPGFCYLGGMDKGICTPRKEVPDTKILAGSVGIAGEQTGIYPIESPGGWQIIGRTPLRLFKPEKDNPFLLEAGNLLSFYPIDEAEYARLNEHDDG